MAGAKGADMFRVKTSNDINVFAFIRENEQDKVFAIFNFSPLEQIIDLEGEAYKGSYTELFSNDSFSFTEGSKITLTPWAFKIYIKETP